MQKSRFYKLLLAVFLGLLPFLASPHVPVSAGTTNGICIPSTIAYTPTWYPGCGSDGGMWIEGPNGSPVPVTGSFPTPIPNPTSTAPAVTTTPASSGTSVTLLAANSARTAFSICNVSTQVLYIAEGGTASSSLFWTELQPTATVNNCYIEEGPGTYLGVISGIWASANGNAIVSTR